MLKLFRFPPKAAYAVPHGVSQCHETWRLLGSCSVFVERRPPPSPSAHPDLSDSFFFNPFSQDSKERLRHPWEQERPKCEYRSTHPCDPATPNKRLCPKIQKPKLNEKNDRDIKSICQPRFVENRTPEMLIHCDAMPKKRRQRERDRPKTSEK